MKQLSSARELVVTASNSKAFIVADDGTLQPLTIGQHIPAGAVVQIADDGELHTEPVAPVHVAQHHRELPTGDGQPTASAASDDIDKLQKSILAGVDPTLNLEATAAGGAVAAATGDAAGSGNGGFIVIDRTSDSTLATAGFDTADETTTTATVVSQPADTAGTATTSEPTNTAPATSDIELTTNEDQPITGAIVATDLDGDSLSYTLNGSPANGSVILNVDGTFTYTPAGDFNGSDRFTVTISDGQGGTTTSTVTIGVTPLNDAPTSADISLTTVEEQAVSGAIVATDLDGDSLRYTMADGPDNGEVTLNSNGTFTYTPAGDFNGSDRFTVIISDGQGGTTTSTVTIGVTPLNDAPTSADISLTTAEEQAVSGAIVATDLDGDSLSYTMVDGPANGEVTLNSNGTFTYTPAGDFNGSDRFTVTISDGLGGTTTSTVTIGVTPLNDAPTSADISLTTAEEQAVSGAIVATDLDGDSLSYTMAAGPTNGEVTLNSNGTFTYTPAGDFNGSDRFTVIISDGQGGTTTSTVTIGVTPFNDAPTSADISLTTAEEQAVSGAIVATDLDGDSLSYTMADGPANGEVTLNSNGTFTYTPAGDFNGSDRFTVTISDGQGGTTTSTVTIGVTPINDAPVAVDDDFTVAEDGSVIIDVLGNDTDVDGPRLTITQVNGQSIVDGGVAIEVTNGIVSLVAGQLVFSPNNNYHGPAQFSYTISDGTSSVIGSVSGSVTPVNDDPVSGDVSLSTGEDTAVSGSIVASDLDGDSLSYTVGTAPANGSVTLNADGSFTYTPATDFHGSDTFTVSVSDGNGGSSLSTVTIDVGATNDGPVAVIDHLTATEDTPATFTPSQLLGNDSDIDGDTLTISSVQGAVNGTVTLDSSGNVVFTPSANYNGPASFTYTISDGNGGSSTATVNLTVGATNDGPVAVIDHLTATEDTVATFTPSQLLGNDTDLDGDTLTISSVQGAVNGSVTLDSSGNVVFTPSANYNGPASFTYTISDGNGGSSTATVNLTVGATNDGPVAVIDHLTATEDTVATFTPSQLLGNDTDLDGDTLTISSVQGAVNGTVTLDSSGNVVFTPSANYNGSASFTYTISDGNGGSSTATVNLTVGATNDGPVAVIDHLTATEDMPATFTPSQLLGNDSDIDGDTLTISSVQGAVNGTVTLDSSGNVVFTPSANYNGPASFTYTISDGNGGSSTATVNLTVGATNDGPVAVIDHLTATEDTVATFTPSQLLGNDTDLDGDTLTISSVQGAVNGTVTLDSSGNVVFTPSANYNGPASFTYTISDGNGGSSTATVNLTVGATNDGPVAVIDHLTATEDTVATFTPSQLLGNDTDLDGDTLTISSVQGAVNGTVTLDSSGNVVFTPSANYNGPASFTYTISDGNGGSSTATVNLTVGATNDGPVAVIDHLTATEDTPATFTPSQLLGNDSDIDGDTLTISSVQGAVNGTVTLDSSGNVVFTPSANYNGPASFTYTISDGNGGSSTATVNLTVGATNDGPVAVIDHLTAIEDTVATFTPSQLLGNDTDLDGDTLTISSVQGAVNGTVTLDSSGNVVFTPSANYNGPASFTYTISDGNGGSSTATVNLTVGATNDGPVAVIDHLTATEDTVATFTPSQLLGNDTDLDGDTLTISSVQGAVNGTVTLDSSGNVVFTPSANYNGPASFTYTISDGNGGSSTATVNLTVGATNDGPVAVIDHLTATEDTPATFTPSQLLGNDSDIDGDTLTISSVQGAVNGTVTLDSSGNVVFTPSANYNGPASFTYTISDGNGGSSTATVNLTVGATNDGPVAVIDHLTATEDTVATFTPSQLLGNDSDLDGDTLTISSVQGAVNGSVTLDSSGNVVFTPSANYNGPASFTYTISDGNGGSSTATVNLTVGATNDGPVAVIDHLTATEDTVATFTPSQLLGNDTDLDGDTLTISSVQGAVNGTVTLDSSGNVVFTPSANYNGSASFTYTISDGNGGSSTATVNLTVGATNDGPVAVIDHLTATEDMPATFTPSQLLGNDSDIDGDTLTISSVQGAVNGTVTLDSSGNVVFTPSANYNGPASFTYTISDGNGGSSTATVNLTVGATNDGPVAVVDHLTATEDTVATFTPSQLLGNDTDLDGDTLTISSVQGAVNGTVTLDSSGNVVFTPSANYNGSASFTYTISDGNGGSSTATVNLTVGATNDGPVAVIDHLTATEDTPATFTPSQLLGNDSDLDGDTLTISSVQGAVNGTVTLDSSGNVVFTPSANYNGSASFTYTISDGNGGSSTATVNLTVGATNDGPVAVIDHLTATEDTPATFTPSQLLGNDSDLDGDTLTISSVQGAVNGTVTLDSSGNVVFTPSANYNGSASFTYTISDGNGGSSTATVNLTVGAVNDAPTLTPGAQVTENEDNPSGHVFTWADFKATDVDSALSSLTVTVNGRTGSVDGLLQQKDGAGNWVTVTGDITLTKADIDAGNLRFVSDSNESGHDSFGGSSVGNKGADYAQFTYHVSDGASNSTTGTLKIDIVPDADTPTLTVKSNVMQSIFSTSWESVANNNATSEEVSRSTLEGWSLVTKDPHAGGINVFEVWAAGDSQQGQDGDYNTVSLPAGNGSNSLELNDATTDIAQTIGISRTVQTVVGQVYDLSLDYAGRPGFDASYTKIAVYLGNTLIGEYSSTSPQGDFNWQNVHFSFTGTGNNETITIRLADGNSVNSAGRGALIDDIQLNSQSGTVAGSGTTADKTEISLKNYISGNLTDTDGSEALSYKISALPAGAIIVSSAYPNGYVSVGGVITLSAAELASAKLLVPSTTVGHVGLDVTAVSCEPNGDTASTTSQHLDLTILNKLSSSAVVSDFTTTTLAATSSAVSSSTLGLKSEYFGHADPDGSNNLTSIAKVESVIESRAGNSNSLIGTNNASAPNGLNATFVTNKFEFGFTTAGGSTPLISNNVGNNSNVAAGSTISSGNLYRFLTANGTNVTNLVAGQAGLGNTTDAIIRSVGYIYLANPGSYDFRVVADDGYRVLIDGHSVAAADRIQATTSNTYTNQSLASGMLAIEVLYWDQAGAADFRIEIKPSGSSDSAYKVLGTDEYALFQTGSQPILADNQELLDSGSGTWSIRTGATFVGTDVNDKVTGTDGHDNIQGGGGHDWISGGAGRDTLSGGSGNDTLLGGDGDDRLLDGGSGNDTLDGGLGNDILVGGADDDVLLGGMGNDTLTGGTGDDTFTWVKGDQGTTATPAVDHVTDFDVAHDVLDISDLLEGYSTGTMDVLKQYLSVGTSTDGSTTIDIHNSTATSSPVVQTIVLDGMSYSELTGSSGSTASDVLTHLIDNHLLNIDK